MASLDEIRAARLRKIEILKSKNIDSYPAKAPRDFALSEVRENFKDFEYEGKEFSVAGRVMAIRGQGAILFVVLFDGTDKMQIIVKKDELSADVFSLFTDTVDIGDFISVTGIAMLSQRGEQSVLLKKWTMATKSLSPLPEKWHGLSDIDERYRKRYLDFLMDSELRDLVLKKSKFWDVTRQFLKDEGFLEIETPTLETTTGGAEAEPFKTHHNDYDLDVFLRISVGELWQKRLMAAGFPKTFEIGRVYRNEGSSPEHLQEFTNMEFYWAYADYRDGMELVKKMYRKIAREVFGRTQFSTRGHTFDLDAEWVEIDYCDEIKRQTGIDITTATLDEIKNKLDDMSVKYDGNNLERLVDTLWKTCRKNISGPAFVVGHPTLIAPLAKMATSAGHTSTRGNVGIATEMFQPIIAGSEIGRGYSELNDPVDQKARFEAQQKLLDGGDKEAMMPDMEFVEMLEHGMPPTCGFGFGERFFAFLADKPLRELQLFPLMRPK
jgi:lysyl-tRNA synthetase class 2